MQRSDNSEDEQQEPEFIFHCASTDINVLLVNTAHQRFISSYNVAPTKTGIIIRKVATSEGSHSTNYIMETLAFGLVPFWAAPKSCELSEVKRELQKFQSRQFNCRRESLELKKSVWNSAKNTRCVVPIQGYYEWRKKVKDKTPYLIRSKTSSLLYLAGLYSHNSKFILSGEKDPNVYFSSFAIITGPALDEDEFSLSWLHSRRPILIKPGTREWDEWLNPETEWSPKFISSCLETKHNEAFSGLETYVVSSRVGNTSAEGKELMDKVESNCDQRQSQISSFFKSVKKENTNDDENEIVSNKRRKLEHEEEEENKKDFRIKSEQLP